MAISILEKNWIPWVLSAVVLVELSPINEAVRLAIFIAAQYVWPGAISGALSYGLSTFVVEAAAGMAAALLLSSRLAIRWMDRVRPRMERLVSPGERVSALLELALGLIAGAAVAVVAQDAQAIHVRPRGYAIVHAVRLAAKLALVCALQGALMGAGVRAPSPLTIGLAMLAVVGLALLARSVVASAREHTLSTGLRSRN